MVKALVVDDEPQIRKLLKTGLSGYGYQVITAANGQEALALAAQRSPDVVILKIRPKLLEAMVVEAHPISNKSLALLCKIYIHATDPRQLCSVKNIAIIPNLYSLNKASCLLNHDDKKLADST